MIRSLIAAAGAVLFCATVAFAADAPAPTPSPAPAMPAIVPLPAPAAKPFKYVPKESDIVSGKETAPVTVVEYASLTCPHCAHFFKNIEPELTAKYVDTGKVKFVYRNFLRNSADVIAAKLVECVEVDRRPVFVKVLFDTQMKWIADSNIQSALENIAALGGVDRAKYEACMSDKTLEKAVIEVGQQASDDYHVSSTPTFFINNTLYQGNFEAAAIGKAIDRALENKNKK